MGFFQRLFGGGNKPAAPAPPPQPAKPQENRPAAAPSAPAPAPSPAAAPAASAKPVGETVALSLKVIVSHFPAELKDSVARAPGASDVVQVSLDKVAAQLPSGAVKIPYAEFRQGAPAGIFTEDRRFDQLAVPIPLPEILSKVNPSLMKRRTDQKKVEVPKEVSGLFETKAGTGRQSAGAPVAAAPAAPKAPAPAAAPPSPPSPPAPAAAAPPPPPPAAPKPAPPPPAPAAPIPAPSLPKPPAPAPAAPTAPAVSGTISVSLASITDGWPADVMAEAAKAGANATVELPAGETGQALKMGKVAYAWKQLRGWIRPSPVTAASPADDTVVQLPLKVIAPLFMAQFKPAAPQRKVEVSDSIPDTFRGPAGKPTAPAPALAAPAAAPPPPAPAPAAPRPPAAPVSPAEFVKKACALPGVTGALIALSEGMAVAQQLPAGLKADTLAAFVPQIFTRMTQYAKEMNLGELNSVSFTAGNTPWQICRAGSVYLAIVGRAGETLPTPQINALAADLGRQNKP
jgi:predicted regulator of Ras-like GTPase activity (Roadblock/LC7/MglB family)